MLEVGCEANDHTLGSQSSRMLLQTGHRIRFLACKEHRGGVPAGAVQAQGAHLEEARVHQSWCSGLEQLSVEYNLGSVAARSKELPDTNQRCCGLRCGFI